MLNDYTSTETTDDYKLTSKSDNKNNNKTKKKISANYERELLDLLRSKGFAVVRSPSSGGGKTYPQPDLIAGSRSKNKFLAIELKTTKKGVVYLSDKQLTDLLLFAELFGAEAYIAFRLIGYNDTNYYFFELFTALKNDRITKTANGSMRLDLDTLKHAKLITDLCGCR